MGEEPVRRILTKVGLTEKEADVYIFLAKHGALKGIEIAKTTRIDKAEVYRILKILQRKGLLESTLEAPARFATIPFDKVIDAFVKSRRDEAAIVESTKEDLMKDWANINRTSTEQSTERFIVLEDESKIHSRILQLVKETKNHLSMVSPVADLLRADQFGIIDAFLEHPLGSKIQLRFLTEISEKNADIMRIFLQRIARTGANFVGRSPDLGLRLSPQMVIRDDEEILFYISSKKETSRTHEKDTCLWTNCRTLVQSFKTVFSDLWENSVGIEKRILDITTGKPTTIQTIYDTETALKKYKEVLQAAKEEVFMMTSSEGVSELYENTSLLNEWKRKGVSIKILAPITNDNFKVSESLTKYCEIKHCPEAQLRTVLVDGHHLFQFRNPPLKEDTEQFPNNAIYTNSHEHVQETKVIMYEVWKKANSPSILTNRSIRNGPEAAVNSLWDKPELSRNAYRKWLIHASEREEGTITEKEIIDKMIHAKRLPAKDPMKDMNIQYGSLAYGIIHPPVCLNLPEMIIKANHENKQSSFGAEDWLEISVWLETPKGYAFVPTAHVTDSHKAAEWRKGVFAGTPASKNSMLVKRNQLEVKVHGNTLFAGWTVPIPLLPPKYILPPACILFEGYGELKTDVVRTSIPSGRKQISERNWFNAFVTFFHPASMYQGPGTDGVLYRDRVMTAYPPELSQH